MVRRSNHRRVWHFLFGSSALLFALTLACVTPASAQVTGTAGFETGLQKLADIQDLDALVNSPSPVTIDWGDGTDASCNNLSANVLNSCGLLVRTTGNNCTVYGTHRYAAQGTYTITVSYHPPLHPKKVDHATTSAIISSSRDFVILSIGDSVASGEGNPVIPDSSSDHPSWGFWDDPYSNYSVSPYPEDVIAQWPDQSFPCHRSSIAGPSQAAREVLAKDPGITYLHFACSGAKVTMADTPKNTVEDAVGQLRVARQRLPRIDLLIVSVGANSFTGQFGSGFGELFTYCLSHPLSPCSQNQQFQTDVNNSLNALPSEYEKLAKEINCVNPDDGSPEPSCSDPLNQIPKLVLITEYMDPTHDQNGNFPSGSKCPLDFKGVSASEWQFFYDAILHPLNAAVDKFPADAAAAGLSVPSYAVTKIEQDFLKHGLCSGDQRWVLTVSDSTSALGVGPHLSSDPKNAASGSGHPNSSGQSDYKTRIYNAIIAYNPPVTTASATAGSAPYTFGAWTGQDVNVSFSSANAIQEAGVGTTYYAVDNANCSPAALTNCNSYAGPLTISDSGQHTLTFFGTNSARNPEELQTTQVWIDKSPPLNVSPATQTIHPGQSASYAVTVGHAGWQDQSVNLTCETDDPAATCAMEPASVDLSAPGSTDPTSMAVVTTTSGGLSVKFGFPARPVLGYPLDALRLLLALATALFLLTLVFAVRRHRWTHAAGLAAVAVLCATLCAGCSASGNLAGSPGNSPAPNPSVTYTVTVTGVSGNTSNTGNSSLVVQ